MESVYSPSHVQFCLCNLISLKCVFDPTPSSTDLYLRVKNTCQEFIPYNTV